MMLRGRPMLLPRKPAPPQRPRRYEALVPVPCDCCQYPLLVTFAVKMDDLYRRCTHVGCAKFGVAQ